MLSQRQKGVDLPLTNELRFHLLLSSATSPSMDGLNLKVITKFYTKFSGFYLFAHQISHQAHQHSKAADLASDANINEQ